MQIKFNQKGESRKKMVAIISESLQEKSVYSGVPDFQYQIGAFSLDKEGTLIFDSATIDDEQLRSVLNALAKAGFEYDGSDSLTFGYPIEGFSDEAIANLEKMIAAKAPLLKKALEIDDLRIERTETELSFPWFKAGLSQEETYALGQFISCLCRSTKEKKRVTVKLPDNFDNAAFTMRVWLIGLGMVGDEYKLARKLLVSCQDGCSAWRFGKPEKKAPQEETTAPEVEVEGITVLGIEAEEATTPEIELEEVAEPVAEETTSDSIENN